MSPRARLAIVTAVLGVAALAASLGPSRRVFLPAPRAVAVASTAELEATCRALGLRGRRAVVFGLGLVAAEDPRGDSPDTVGLTDLMHHAVVRELFHVVPDHAWGQVAWRLDHVSIYRPTDEGGRVAAFEDGRINAQRLSRFRPGREPVVVLVDPAAWSPDEAGIIAGLLRAGRLRADLVAVLRGTPAEVAEWAGALAAAPR